jgi:hypothetical protein
MIKKNLYLIFVFEDETLLLLLYSLKKIYRLKGTQKPIFEIISFNYYRILLII